MQTLISSISIFGENGELKKNMCVSWSNFSNENLDLYSPLNKDQHIIANI